MSVLVEIRAFEFFLGKVHFPKIQRAILQRNLKAGLNFWYAGKNRNKERLNKKMTTAGMKKRDVKS